MVNNFSNYDGKSTLIGGHYTERSLSTLQQLDGSPGDLNKNENAIAMQTPLGQVDAVILSDPDGAQTVVQRLTRSGGKVTSWLEVPAKDEAVFTSLSGFEISEDSSGNSEANVLSAVRTSFGGYNSTHYRIAEMPESEREDSLIRAEAVLAAYPVQSS